MGVLWVVNGSDKHSSLIEQKKFYFNEHFLSNNIGFKFGCQGAYIMIFSLKCIKISNNIIKEHFSYEKFCGKLAGPGEFFWFSCSHKGNKNFTKN